LVSNKSLEESNQNGMNWWRGI